MYYYLFEPTQNSTTKRWQTRLKEKLSNAGIAGEYVTPSPARSIDELVQMGVDKGYSTIVAIGDDLFINKVASYLIVHSLKADRDKIVLGLAPTNKQKSFFGQFGVTQSDEVLINTLKTRHLIPTSVGLVQPNKFFLNPIKITRPQPFTSQLITESYRAHLSTTQVTITTEGIVTVAPLAAKKSFLSYVKNLFGKYDSTQSTFSANQAQLESQEPIPVYLEGEVIAKTPISFQIVPKLLHIIVSRDKLGSSTFDFD
jgi:diacylglycerol kinase family enzyme